MKVTAAMHRQKATGLAVAALYACLFAASVVGFPRLASAQAKGLPAAPGTPSGGATDGEVARQIADLRAAVARLEGIMSKTPPGGGMGKGMASGMSGDGTMPTRGAGGRGPGRMAGGMMDDDMAGGGAAGGMMDMMKMGGMSGGGMSGGGMSGGAADDGMEMMGTMGMGRMEPKGMPGMSRMKAASALPGFPGASHIYHIGATGFFLDHPEHVTLATEQQAKLNGIKQKALLEKATAQREIEEAEQQLWELTAADEPDIEQIQAKVERIEKLRGGQRLAFVRAVGEAAQVLTDEQRKAMLGTVEPASHNREEHQTPK